MLRKICSSMQEHNEDTEKEFTLLLREVRKGRPGKMIELSFTGDVIVHEGRREKAGPQGTTMQDACIVNSSCVVYIIGF